MSNIKEFENIKVGDKVIISSAGIRRIAEVTKVTPTTFSCGNYVFNKNGHLRGANRWCRTFAFSGSAERIKEIELEAENRDYSHRLAQYDWFNVNIELKKNIWKMLKHE